MRRHLLTLGLALLPVLATAYTIDDYRAELPHTNSIQVYFDLGLNEQNPNWSLPRPLWPVLFERIAAYSEPHVTDKLFQNFTANVENYRGLQLRFELQPNSAVQLPPLRVFDGRISTPQGASARDPGRLTEYWLFGTAPRDAVKIALIEALPVFTYEQCRIMGNPIVQTTPKQCVLPDKSLLLNLNDDPVMESLTVTSFQECLKYGRALIDTFPRRCLLPGGRVLAEPPVPLEYFEQRQRNGTSPTAAYPQ